MNRFVFLECHSHYSFCEGTISIPQLIGYAKQKAFPYLALCDTNGFYGLIEFVQACEEASIRPIIGSRIKTHDFSALLIARSMRGYALISHFITQLHLNDDFDLKRELIERRDRDYFIVSPDQDLLLKKPDIAWAEVNPQRQDYVTLYTFALKHRIRPVFIYPVYFAWREDFRVHKTLRAIFHKKKVGALTKDDIESPYAFFPDEGALIKQYQTMSDAFLNTASLAERAQFPFQYGRLIFPKFGEDSFSRLKGMCLSNIPKRYPNMQVKKAVMDRLTKELEIINKKKFADYFLVVWDIVRQGGMYTCGRGSGAASIVSYLLFITHVDPLKHHLYFERFLNEERQDPPDIDIDFAWDEKDKITQYIFDKYGDKCAMVANHITFSVKSSLHEAAKLYGLPEKEIMKVSRHISAYHDRQKDVGYKAGDEQTQITSLANKIAGNPRFLGLHCGGVVITPKPIRYYVPLQRATKGFNIIQWEKDQAEDFGLVKIDVLGNRSLAVVRDAIKAIKENYGIEIRYERLNPLEDRKVIGLIEQGLTIGCFYIESPATRQLLKKAGRGDYEHVVIYSSAVRPAASKHNNELIERIKGKTWQPLIPEMGPILNETYGIMVYQEQISQLALAVGDFTMAEADELRKVVANEKKHKRKLALKKKLVRNMQLQGIKDAVIEELWEMIESFSGYSFCKPHSASYALLSFKCAWLKVYYPAEFLACVLSNGGGFFGPIGYLSEARRFGIEILPVDINHSRREYRGNKKTLRVGFMAIKNLPCLTTDALLEERERGGKYLGVINFMLRTRVSVIDTETLIKAGCFSAIENYNLPQLLVMTREFEAQRDVCFDNEETILRELKPPALKPYSPVRAVENELERFGFLLSMHPMKYFRSRVKDRGVILGKELNRYAGRDVRLAGIMITTKTVLTKNEELMKFVSFEDETAIFETVLFPRVYEKWGRQLEYMTPYLIKGRAEEEYGVVTLNVQNLQQLKA